MITKMSSAEAARLFGKREGLPRFWRGLSGFLLEKPLAAFGGMLVVVMLLMGILADTVAPYGLNETHLDNTLEPPGATFWFGTDELGRDVLSRVIYGARISLYVGLGAVGVGKLSAIFLGVVTGYFGGKLDLLAQRLVDAWMAFPPLVILLTIMGIVGPGLLNIIFALALSQTFASSRVIRSAVLAIRENQYVE